MKSKSEIRKEIRLLKHDISDFDKQTASDAVFSVLFELEEWKNAESVLLYHSLPDELSTLSYLDKIIDKKLYLPKVNGEVLDILPYSGETLQIGAYNILEPNTTSGKVSPQDLDLIVVPGMAFDTSKNRLGRGKGYYDRLLSSCQAIKIGVCYDFQFLEFIPCDKHDVKMDIIITPSKLIR